MNRVPKRMSHDDRNIHGSAQLDNPRRSDKAEGIIGGPHPDQRIGAGVLHLPANQARSGGDDKPQR